MQNRNIYDAIEAWIGFSHRMEGMNLYIKPNSSLNVLEIRIGHPNGEVADTCDLSNLGTWLDGYEAHVHRTIDES